MKDALLAAFGRTFVIQGSWNYDRLIGIGTSVAMSPLLRGAREGAVARSAQFFNAHPYLAGAAVGALARAERDRVDEQQIVRLRTALSGPLGSLGDSLFWAGVVRAASGLGLVLSALVSVRLGVVALLVTHNVPHLITRGWCVWVGWRDGPAVGQALNRPALREGVVWAQRGAAFMVGMAIAVLGATVVAPFPGAAALGAMVIAFAAAVSARWLAPTVGGVRLALFAVGLAVLAGVVWP